MAKNSGPNEAPDVVEYICVQSCTGAKGQYYRKGDKYTLQSGEPVPKSSILGPLLIPVAGIEETRKRKPRGTGAAAINEALGIEIEAKGDE